MAHRSAGVRGLLHPVAIGGETQIAPTFAPDRHPRRAGAHGTTVDIVDGPVWLVVLVPECGWAAGEVVFLPHHMPERVGGGFNAPQIEAVVADRLLVALKRPVAGMCPFGVGEVAIRVIDRVLKSSTPGRLATIDLGATGGRVPWISDGRAAGLRIDQQDALVLLYKQRPLGLITGAGYVEQNIFSIHWRPADDARGDRLADNPVGFVVGIA